METDVGNNVVRILLATVVVLVMGVAIGYIVRRTELDRRFSTPICVLIIIPAWLVLGLFHLVLWHRIAIILLLYQGAVLCAGTSIGSEIAEAIRRRRGGQGQAPEEHQS